MGLKDDDYDLFSAALEALRADGPSLGRPLVDTLTGARHKNFKELRPDSSGRTEIRILFAFDPCRQAILLVAGDKAGAWKKWYPKNIPLAEERLDGHLQALRSTPPGAAQPTRRPDYLP
ncbi:type II toxin-antitoxin system RelE/ParE family toxin [Micrococcus luteus]